ncbi:hypothetical protein CRM22_006255 [Opisthorchis felineus]|uniref:Trematode Eggshell Synthesis n=1 Tax=Opisthorchis felineus TaxID=147828 RepID=A0A4S2LNN0_OPIFE|nr:hypothetical protein CRM22_006255 [Opisthorchis felineus]
MKLVAILLVALLPAVLGDGYYGPRSRGHGRFYRGAYGDHTGRQTAASEYDLRGRLSQRGESSYSGDWDTHAREDDKDFYEIGGRYAVYGKAADDTDYGLNAYLKAKGKFYGHGNEEQGSKFEQFTKFRRGGGHDSYGKKKHYNDYDTYGQMKKYGNRDVSSKFEMYGKLKAKGKFDAYGKSDVASEFDKYGKYGQSGSSKDYADRDVYGKLSGYGKYKSYGKLSGYGSQDDYSKHGRHADYDELGY